MSQEFNIVNVFHYQLDLHAGQASPQFVSSLLIKQILVEFNASQAMFISWALFRICVLLQGQGYCLLWNQAATPLNTRYRLAVPCHLSITPSGMYWYAGTYRTSESLLAGRRQ